MSCEIGVVLAEAEINHGLLGMCRDRAACGGWPLPESPGEYAAWLADEAEIQREQAHHDVPEERIPYAGLLESYVARLKALGVEPVALPWTVDAS